MRALLLTSVLALSACAHIDHRIESAAVCFDDARYDDALVWLADLDDDVGRMPYDDETFFYYLRGMTAFRLDRRTEALHYLSLAHALIETHSVSREGVDTALLERTLAELTPTTMTWEAPAAAAAASEPSPTAN
jgi:hypothetical protein